MKVKSFDRTTLKLVRAKLNKALSKCGVKLGIDFTVGHISFRDHFCTVKVEATIKGASSKTADAYGSMRLLNSKLPKLGTVVTLNGKSFKIIGGNPRASKNSIHLERVEDGKTFTTSAEHLLAMIAKK